MVDGEKRAKPRLMAEGYQDLDPKNGPVETSGRVSLRSPHLQVVSLRALGKWGTGSLGVKTASLRADGFGRGVSLRSPAEWDPGGSHRIRKLRVPAYGLNDAWPAPRREPQSLARAGLRFQISSLGPR